MANSNDNNWLKESLEEGMASSMEPATEHFAKEAKYIAGEEYAIPFCYYRDKVVFLPVNRDTSYVYWEITEGFLADSGAVGRELVAKVYDLEEGERELCGFGVHHLISNMYVHFRVDMHPVQVCIGYMDEAGHFVILLRSNVFTTPGTEVHFSDDEVWMSIDGDTKAIIRASLGGGDAAGENLSSRSILEERVVEMARKRIYSSHTPIKKDD